MRAYYTIEMGYPHPVNTPDVGAVARPRTQHRAAGSFALTIRLDVEALDEQIQRESDAAEYDHEGW